MAKPIQTSQPSAAYYSNRELVELPVFAGRSVDNGLRGILLRTVQSMSDEEFRKGFSLEEKALSCEDPSNPGPVLTEYTLQIDVRGGSPSGMKAQDFRTAVESAVEYGHPDWAEVKVTDDFDRFFDEHLWLDQVFTDKIFPLETCPELEAWYRDTPNGDDIPTRWKGHEIELAIRLKGALRPEDPVLYRRLGCEMLCRALMEFPYAQHLREVLAEKPDGTINVPVLYPVNRKMWDRWLKSLPFVNEYDRVVLIPNLAEFGAMIPESRRQ